MVRFMPVALFDRIQKPAGFRIPHSLRFVTGLIRYRRRIGRSTIHVHRVETGCFVSLFLRQPYVQYVHSNSRGLLGPKSDSMWKHLPWLHRRVERRAVGRAMSVAIFNKEDAPRLAKLASSLTIAETWFDPRLFCPSPEGALKDIKEIVWVGRLDHGKDPWLVMSAAEEAWKNGQDWVFTIIGDGPLMKELQRHVTVSGLGNVRLLGALPHEQVASVLRRSRVFLMTSYYEGSPTALLEALACALPVAITRESDPDGLVRDGVNGSFIDQRDGDRVNHALRQCFELKHVVVSEPVKSRSADRLVPVLANLDHAARRFAT
ncbi:glycosyltransferase involved in cell wall biosynthesis [Kocuria rosea]|nr:glycosyltransferase involved in cell wall biosynthesis [Kocuria rosea]